MANIRISPEQMRGRAGEFRTQGQAVEDVLNAMDNLVDALQGEWEGQSSKDFADRFTEIRPGFVAAIDLIGEIATALDQVANKFEEFDNGLM